jgi:xanthine dehydrogenase YagS FAD-binding subunit
MYPFTLLKAKNAGDAIKAVTKTAHFIGGGTNLIDLMKMNVEMPSLLIDISEVELKKIEMLPNGNIMVGALVSNTDLAYDNIIVKNYPLLSQALLSGASPQLRNMATAGGNLLQRTRCPYFFDTATPCNKRIPGSGCSAINGYNRMNAILGTSSQCIATHPSDMSVALAALDAVVHVQGIIGKRTIAFAEFYTLPGNTPNIENTLQRGELITHIEIPALPFASNSCYVKVRDRHSYEFAVVSAAIALDKSGGLIKQVRIALGGVGTKPWRATKSEQFLTGKNYSKEIISEAGVIALQDAKTFTYNGFKPALAKRTIMKAFQNIEA